MTFYCKAKVGHLPINLRILDTSEEKSMGYQHQKTPPKFGEGSLFLFDNEKPRRFHMNNVHFDLDLLGFDCKGKLICKIPMKSNSRIFYKTPPVKFIIEAPKGWAKCLQPGGCHLRVTRVL